MLNVRPLDACLRHAPFIWFCLGCLRRTDGDDDGFLH